jgi:thiaminase
MPCYFIKKRVKDYLKQRNIRNTMKLNKKLLENYSDSELHAMSEKEIIEAIKKVYRKHKKEIDEDIQMIYV